MKRTSAAATSRKIRCSRSSFKNPKNFLIAVGLKISEVSWVYILTIFVVVYATSQLELPKALLLQAIFIAALVEVITIPLFGYLSDLYGRRLLYFVGTIFTFCFAFPLFWLIQTKDPQIIILTIVAALSFGHGTMFGLQSAYFPELFGTRVRYSGASVGFQVAAALGGGFAPLIATALAGYMGGTAGVSVMLILLAMITFTATCFARETKDDSLTGDKPPGLTARRLASSIYAASEIPRLSAAPITPASAIIVSTATKPPSAKAVAPPATPALPPRNVQALTMPDPCPACSRLSADSASRGANA